MSGSTLVADQLLELLRAWDVSHVFACPGSTEAAVLAAAARQSDVQLMLTTHEGVAVSMADGFARETGRPAVAYLHANVGLTNGLGHLYAAQLARSPVVILNGLKQTAIQSRGGFTTAPHMRDFVRQYVKWDWQTLRPESVVEDVNRALRTAATSPQGPAWVGLSQDLVEAHAPAAGLDVERFRVSGRARPAAAELDRLAGLLTSARRPVLIAGADLAGGGTPLLVELAERLGATVVAEDRRTWERSVVPTLHPAYAGMYDHRRPSIAGADLLFFVGARCFVEFEAPSEPEIPAGATAVQLHPDPAEVAKVYGLDLALTGDARSTLEGLLDLVAPPAAAELIAERADLRARARAEHAERRAAVLTREPHPTHLTVPEVMSALAAVVDESTVVVSDATTSGGTLLHAMEGTSARVHATSSGSLGWGMGTALGAKLASPSDRVIAVLGDGVFQFGVQALWTAVRYGIAVDFVVVNNQAYAAVGAAIRRYAGAVTDAERRLTVDLPGPRIAEVAAAFGVPASRVETRDQLDAALSSAAATPGPTLTEVLTDPLDLGP